MRRGHSVTAIPDGFLLVRILINPLHFVQAEIVPATLAVEIAIGGFYGVATIANHGVVDSFASS